MQKNTLTIATRKSPLALWQAEFVKSELEKHHPALTVTLLTMSTQGDKILDAPLAKIGGKGLFVKELEKSILDGDADIAVHSMKDVPVDFPPGLCLPVICEREDPRDAFVSNAYASWDVLPMSARVGTSSLRRQCQLRTLRPDLVITDLRGNVGSRLAKLDQGQFDAIILASAGLLRLGLSDRITQYLPTEVMLPAVGQGAVGIECREADSFTQDLLRPLNHEATALRVLAERTLNHRLEGGCQVPIAGFAELKGAEIYLRGLVGYPDGSKLIRGDRRGAIGDANSLARSLGDELLENGARVILSQIYGREL